MRIIVLMVLTVGMRLAMVAAESAPATMPGTASAPASAPADGPALASLIDRLGSSDPAARAAAREELLRVGPPARGALQKALSHPEGPATEAAREVLAQLDRITRGGDGALLAELRGRRVLLSFLEFLPAGGDLAAARAERIHQIDQALAKAGVSVVRVVNEGDPRRAPRALYRLLLLDCGDAAPAEALKDVPARKAGMVFQDGAFQEALADPASGKKPAAYGFVSWPIMALDRKEAQLAEWAEIPGLSVKFVPPPPDSGGGAGYALLTPKEGTTLLEVFLWTGAGFDPRGQ